MKAAPKSLQIIAFFVLILLSAHSVAEAPCDLTKDTDFPKPIFVEEFHDNELSQKVREELMNYGALGAFPVATEATSSNSLGVLFDRYIPETVHFYNGNPKTALIHSIESEIHYTVAMSYELQALKIHQINPPSQLLLSIMKYIIEFPVLNQAWKEFYSTQKNNIEVTKLNSLLQDQEFISATGKERGLKMFETFSKVNEAEFSNIVDGIHKALIQIVNRQYSEKFDRQILPVTTDKDQLQKFGCIGYPCQREGLYKKVTLDFRDEMMAQSIANILCTYKGRYKNIFVIMGRSHSDGIWQLLKNWSNANTAVLAFQYSSYQPSNVTRIREKIKETLKE